MTKYIVMESAAQVKGKMAQFGPYRRIAVVEIEDSCDRPAMISERARSVVRIVQEWSPMHRGKTERSEYYVARKAAERLAAFLNNPDGPQAA